MIKLVAKATGTAALLGLAVSAASTMWAQPSYQDDAGREPVVAAGSADTSRAAGAQAGSERLREGTELTHARGFFRPAGDVPVFVDASGRELAGLENLNLQRVSRTLNTAEDPTDLEWEVSGVITEYEGRNYLLIERAVYSRGRR